MMTGDLEHRKKIQLRLVHLIHAKKCQDRELKSRIVGSCMWSCCKLLKQVLNHVAICLAGNNCLEIYCYSSKKIITHWTSCQSMLCDICMPLKEAERLHNETCQLNYQEIQMLDSVQLNLDESVIPPDNSTNQSSQVQNQNKYPKTAPAIVIQPMKEWQFSVSFTKRAQNVNMIIQSLMAPFDIQTLCNGKFKELSNYAQDIERGYYELASNESEYDCLVLKNMTEMDKKNETI